MACLGTTWVQTRDKCWKHVFIECHTLKYEINVLFVYGSETFHLFLSFFHHTHAQPSKQKCRVRRKQKTSVNNRCWPDFSFVGCWSLLFINQWKKVFVSNDWWCHIVTCVRFFRAISSTSTIGAWIFFCCLCMLFSLFICVRIFLSSFIFFSHF